MFDMFELLTRLTCAIAALPAPLQFLGWVLCNEFGGERDEFLLVNTISLLIIP